LIAHIFGYRIPQGLDEVFTLQGLFLASLIATLSCIPQISDNKSGFSQYYQSQYGTLILSVIIAVLSAVGGGVLRRLITGDPTIFSYPASPWWLSMFAGWFTAWFAFKVGWDSVLRRPVAVRFLEKLDHWSLGVFAVAGVIAASRWKISWLLFENIFVQLLIASVFAGITGAAGGLLARVIAKLTFEYSGMRALLSELHTWLFKEYTQFSFFLGAMAFVAHKSITNLLGLSLNNDAYVIANSVEPSIFFTDMISGSVELDSPIVNLFMHSEPGQLVLLYVTFGFFCCYQFRLSE
jgi:uncharacterized membrane protein YeiH